LLPAFWREASRYRDFCQKAVKTSRKEHVKKGNHDEGSHLGACVQRDIQIWLHPNDRPICIPLPTDLPKASAREWTGTGDRTAFLCVGAAISFHRRLRGRTLIARNAALSAEANSLLHDRLNAELGSKEVTAAAMSAHAY
jgi:hypothetical protein